MSGSQVLAWLTCLMLAFLACVLGAYNLGRQRLVERDVDEMKTELAAARAAPGAAPAGDVERPSNGGLERLRLSVTQIRSEVATLKALEGELPDGVWSELQAEIERLDTLVAELEQALQGPVGPALGPPGD